MFRFNNTEWVIFVAGFFSNLLQVSVFEVEIFSLLPITWLIKSKSFRVDDDDDEGEEEALKRATNRNTYYGNIMLY